MHSSRIHTAHFNGHLVGGGLHLSLGGVHPLARHLQADTPKAAPWVDTPSAPLHARRHPHTLNACWDTHPPP